MSMPIQRQSEAFGIFDDGPRFARDRASHDLPKGIAALVNTSGPRIQAGLLNTRQAVNTDGMDPDSHAYGRQPYDPLFGEFGHDGYDYEGVSRGEFNHRMRDRDVEQESQDAREDEDDDSGYNWGPVPPEHLGSRHPFDRLAETTLPGGSDRCDWCGEEGPTNRWQGASVPGRPSRSEDVCPDCVDAIPHKDEYQRFVDENHNGRHGRRAFNDFHNKTKMGNDDLWSWSNWMEGVQQRGHAAHDLEHAWESDLRNNRDGLDQLLRPHRWEASRHPFDRAAAARLAKDDGKCTCWEGYERVPGTEPCASKSCRKKTSARVALAPAPVDPAAAQMPMGGGLLPAHRVGLDWRDRTVPGTVIGVDPSQVHIRWDDGQYTSEEPNEVHLL